jgi:hypothetical protein
MNHVGAALGRSNAFAFGAYFPKPLATVLFPKAASDHAGRS